ncbi:MAG: hypothetical protein AABX17_00415 [Nanoarchaeota archaeon]
MKVMNVVFGIGIAVILFIVVMLGTQVFYSEPLYEDYCNYSMYPQQVSVYGIDLCSDNMSVRECNLLIKEKQPIFDKQQAYYNECQTKYNDASKIYGKNLFIINNVVGIIAIIVSLFLFGMINIAAGTAFAGLALIIYGFMRGWQGIGDTLKFIVALVVAVLFIMFAVIVNKRYTKPSKKK